MSLDRREAIKRTALIMGGLVFAPSAIGVLNGCKARPGVDWDPQFFDNEQARFITILSDIIIPDTDTPGASAAGVPAFIEEMVFTAYDEEARERFISGLDAFNSLARDEHGSRYLDLDPEVQFRFADSQNRAAVGGEHMDEPATAFFLVMKELTLMGYFTSEIGATQTLRYEKVPGRYEGCIPFEEVGKTWAT
jgi:gluconate 2-dehydrogenase gamma chain